MNINKRIKTIVMSGLLCLTANNAYSQTDSLRIMTEQSDSITALQSSLPAETTLSKDDSVLIARNMPLKKCMEVLLDVFMLCVGITKCIRIIRRPISI